MNKTVVFDIDGTLAITGDRLKYLQTEPKNWDMFYSKCWEDKVNRPVATIYRLLHKAGKNIIVMTGRRSKERYTTLSWFKNNNLPIDPKNLYMRKGGDFRSDYIIKREMVKAYPDEIDVVFEDRDQCVRMFRDEGITCLQVADGNF